MRLPTTRLLLLASSLWWGIMTACSNKILNSKDASIPSASEKGTQEQYNDTTTQDSNITTIHTNHTVAMVAPLLAGDAYQWEQIAGPGSLTFSSPMEFQTDVAASQDGEYLFQIRVTYQSNQHANTSVTQYRLIWDTQPPQILSIKPIHEADDAIITENEYLATNPVLEVTATDDATILYTNFVDAAIDVACDDSKFYSLKAPPIIMNIPPSNGPYLICIMLSDEAGNSVFEKSPIIYRNVTFLADPGKTSLVKANEAGDGYINFQETTSALPIVNLQTTAKGNFYYSAILPANGLKCDGLKSYLYTAIPMIKTMPPNDGPYVVCFRLKDDAGVTTYGQSDIVIRDTAAPSFTSLNGTNEALDGYLTPSELASTKDAFTLLANDFISATYTVILDNTPPISCDGSQTYLTNQVPTIQSFPAVDDGYAACVKLTDQAGNITYGKSQAIIRDTLPPASLTVTGAPSGYSNLSTLNVTVGGDSVSHYQYKVGAAGSMDCSIATGYSAEAKVSQPLITSLAAIPDGPMILCVNGRDLAGNWLNSTSVVAISWIKDSTVPGMPTSLTVTPANSQLTLSYAAGSGGTLAGYLVVQSTSPMTWSPTQGSAYNVGNLDASTDIIYAGTATTHTKNPMVNGQTYYYMVWAYNAQYHYSSAASANTTLLDPQSPLKTVKGYDGALVNSTSMELGVWGTSTSGTLTYEFQISTNATFSTILATQTAAAIPSGNTAFTTFTGLTSGTIYFWRARLSNGASWSPYSATASFKVDTSLNYVAWQVDNKEQFDQGTFTDSASSTTNNGQVAISTSTALSGIYYTKPLKLSEIGWSGWGAAYWEANSCTTSGCAITGTVQYWNGTAWADVPTYLAPLNSPHILPLGSLDPNIYQTLRIKVILSRNSTTVTTASLRWVRVTPKIDRASVLTNGNFDNSVTTEWTTHASGGTVTPTLNYMNTATPAPLSASYDFKITVPTGSLGLGREAWAQQTFDIPAGSTLLKFYYQAVTSAWGAPVKIFINGKEIGLINPGGMAKNLTTWTLWSYDISAYVGQTVTLTIGSYDVGASSGKSDHGAWWAFDNLTIE